MIAIDARTFFRRRPGGFYTYQRELLPRLLSHIRKDLILLTDEIGPGVTPEIRAASRSLGGRHRVIYENVLLPRYINSHPQIKLVHLLENICPPFLRESVKVITTVHDMFSLDESRGKRPSDYYVRSGLLRAMRRSDGIITVSEHSRREIERLSHRAGDVYVIHNGGPQVPANTAHVAKSGLLVLVGPDPRKNWEYAVEVARAYQNRQGGASGLIRVVVSRRTILPKLTRRLKGLMCQVLVEPTDAVYYQALARTKVLLFPSRDEGFGLPVLEAMAFGVLVAAFPKEVVDEITDGHFFRLHDSPYETARQLADTLGDDFKFRDMVSRGHLRSRDFSWDRTVVDTVNAYCSVIS